MDRNDPPGADAIVMGFFAEERQTIDANPSLKQIERIARLGSLFTPPLTISVISAPFETAGRSRYFDDVCCWIQAEDRPTVAFIDPDVGIATESMDKPSEKHVTELNLKQVWPALVSGSPLVV